MCDAVSSLWQRAQINPCLQCVPAVDDGDNLILFPPAGGDDDIEWCAQKVTKWTFQLQLKLAGRLRDSLRYF